MAEIDAAFYRLTVAQRDAAWAEIERLRFALKTASDQLAMAASYLSRSNQTQKATWVQGWADDARSELGAMSDGS
jgi:hypothetical protein